MLVIVVIVAIPASASAAIFPAVPTSAAILISITLRVVTAALKALAILVVVAATAFAAALVARSATIASSTITITTSIAALVARSATTASSTITTVVARAATLTALLRHIWGGRREWLSGQPRRWHTCWLPRQPLWGQRRTCAGRCRHECFAGWLGWRCGDRHNWDSLR
jgi:hypothetical protein